MYTEEAKLGFFFNGRIYLLIIIDHVNVLKYQEIYITFDISFDMMGHLLLITL